MTKEPPIVDLSAIRLVKMRCPGKREVKSSVFSALEKSILFSGQYYVVVQYCVQGTKTSLTRYRAMNTIEEALLVKDRFNKDYENGVASIFNRQGACIA